MNQALAKKREKTLLFFFCVSIPNELPDERITEDERVERLEHEEREKKIHSDKNKTTRMNFVQIKIFKIPTHHMTRPVSILRGVQIYFAGTR
jgi:hypothetical protein